MQDSVSIPTNKVLLLWRAHVQSRLRVKALKLSLSEIKERSTDRFFSKDWMAFYRNAHARYRAIYDKEQDKTYVEVSYTVPETTIKNRALYLFNEQSGTLDSVKEIGAPSS